MVLASLSFVANTAIGYIFLAYLLAYGTTVLKLSRGFMLTVVIIGSVVWLVSIIVAAVVRPGRAQAGLPRRLRAAGGARP